MEANPERLTRLLKSPMIAGRRGQIDIGSSDRGSRQMSGLVVRVVSMIVYEPFGRIRRAVVTRRFPISLMPTSSFHAPEGRSKKQN